PLGLDAVAGHPTGADLATVRDELAEQRGVLVVDTGRLLLAELANLLLGLANHCLGHCGASFREARRRVVTEPEWLRDSDFWTGDRGGHRSGSGQNGGSSEPTPGAPHGAWPRGGPADWPE